MEEKNRIMSPLEDQDNPDEEKTNEASCEEEEQEQEGTPIRPSDVDIVRLNGADVDENIEEGSLSNLPPKSNSTREGSLPGKTILPGEEDGDASGLNIDEKGDTLEGDREGDTKDQSNNGVVEQVEKPLLSTDLLSETSASRPDPPSILDESLLSMENLDDNEDNHAIPTTVEPSYDDLETEKSSLGSPLQGPMQAPSKAEADIATFLVDMGNTPTDKTKSELQEEKKSSLDNEESVDQDEGTFNVAGEKSRPTHSPGPSPVINTNTSYAIGKQQPQLPQEQQQANPPQIMQPALEYMNIRGASPDRDIQILPPVDENRLHVDPLQPQGFLSHPPPLQQQIHPGYLHHPMQQQQQQPHPLSHHHAMQPPPQPTMMLQQTSSSTRRKIRLRLQEERSHPIHHPRQSILGHLRKRSQNMMFGSNSFSHVEDDTNNDMIFDNIDRGNISVSWFVGTSSLELHEHVRRSVIRKLKLEKHVQLVDMRLLDETVDPPEEIVLSPYIPDGSEFLLQFSLHDTSTGVANDGTMTPVSQYSSRAPDSPSAAPSPHHSKDLFSSLNPNQLALLKLPTNKKKKPSGYDTTYEKSAKKNAFAETIITPRVLDTDSEEKSKKDSKNDEVEDNRSVNSAVHDDEKDDSDDNDDMMMHAEDPIEARLRQITELMLSGRQKRGSTRRQEKRQVVFVLANYFVLFISLIAISAEIQARAPRWLQSLENHMKDVSDCAADKEALFECVTNGDFAGLVASVMFWLTRSVATRKFFLFGFETPGKLWTVVYESFVTAICWGISYLFIRRGMNPDTRSRFLQKYWKDAVYGSLAGFNAAFLKQVLKNLIPQEAVEAQMAELVSQRQLRFLSWLPSFE